MPGVNGDLATITYYMSNTPVIYTSSNVPMSELEANMLVLDGKIGKRLHSGMRAITGAGDGTFTFSVSLPAPVFSAATYQVTLGLMNISAQAAGKLVVEVANRTTSAFDIVIYATGTSGAWTGDVGWIANLR